VTVIDFSPRRLSEDDVHALRAHILRLIARGRADWWDLDMANDGYAAVRVLGPCRDPLYAITKVGGAYRVNAGCGRPLLQSRRLTNVLAVLA
jgi:hypothetical protein